MSIGAPRRRFSILMTVTMVLAIGVLAEGVDEPSTLSATPADYARAEHFVLDNPDELVANVAVLSTWVGKSDQFWYLRDADGRKEFVLFDATTLERKSAFDHQKLAAMLTAATGGEEAAATGLPFTHFSYTDGRSAILVNVGMKDWHCSFETEACEEVPPVAPPNHLVSPDGARALYIQDHDLWVRDVDGSDRRALTTDGEEYLEYGKSPDMNTFAVTLRRMLVPLPPLALWSPDSKKILVGRLDERQVDELHLLQSAPESGSVRPKLHTYRYAMPGDEEIPELELFIIDVDSGKRIAVDYPPLASPYMTVFEEQRIWWHNGGSRVYVIDTNRGDTTLRLLEINPKNGSVRELITETGDTYVEPGLSLGGRPVVRILGDGEEIVWFSERDGWGQLYLHDGRTGKLENRITNGDFVVRDILRVDEQTRQLYFMAGGREDGDPYYTSLYRVNLDGTGLELLTPEPAQHDIVIRPEGLIAKIMALVFPNPAPMAEGLSPSGRYFVDTYSRVNQPPVSVLRSIDGTLLATLETADTTVLDRTTNRPLPEPFTVKARDGETDIYGVLYRPHDFDENARYPVIDAIYGGPQALRTPKSFKAALSDDAAGFAELGFVVMIVDGFGTPYRSKAFHDASVGHLEEAGGLEDHIAALHQLAELHPWMDTDRVGIFGHSGGGFASTRAILAYPDVFKVAVSSAGNHDQRGYISEWGERYLGLMETAEDGTTNYDAQINARLAENLEGKLLLMHGDMDDNVHPALTMQVVDALIKANKDFDLLIMTNAHHGSSMFPYFIRRRWDYFVENLLGATPPAGYEVGAPKVSEFGKYQGYSHVKYEEFKRTSVYIPAEDGTRLAVDVYRPSSNGQPAAEALPAVLSLTRYYRAYQLPDGSIRTIVGTLEAGESVGSAKSESPRPALEILRHGYVVVSADVRGTGASFGKGVGTEAMDARDIIGWIADQPWCDGNVGMVGRSYLGTVQLMAAAANPPSLKAIFPAVPSFFDGHRILYGGGVMRKGGVVTMRNTLAALAGADEPDAKQNTRFGGIDVPPVDADPDGVLRDEARSGHGEGSFEFYLALWRADANAQAVVEKLGLESEAEVIDALIATEGLVATLEAHPEIEEQLVKVQFYRRSFTDMLPDAQGSDNDGTGEVMAILDQITTSGVASYFWDGWRDPLPHDRALFYDNIDVPKRITYGPWTHGYNEPNDPREEASATLEAIEQLRWFDYWLKGIENGVMDEPPVTYAVMDTKEDWTWRTTDALPIPEAEATGYFFGQGRVGSVDSTNDGVLSQSAPTSTDAADIYTVDYTATSGTTTRLHDTTGGGPEFYPDMTENDAKGLTYTSAVLEEDLVIAGYPIVTLFVSADVADHELTVYLEEVEADGYSRYLTQNSLMASHRTLGTPKFSNLGLPWATSTRADVDGMAPLTDGVAEVQIVLEPVANLFNAGHRIRVTITGADADLNWSVPRSPPAHLTIARNAEYPSGIVLPVVK